MADISSDLKNWSATAASNSPSGTTSIATGLDDNLRAIQAVVRQDLATKGADIASAATTDVGAVAGFAHDITGTTTITGLGTVSSGIHKVIKFEGALTLTHNATSLILPGGANITTADGDIGWFISEGSGNWRCISYQKASGYPIIKIASGTEQASTSGTSIDFTSIPSWVKRITVSFVGVSTSGTAAIMAQIGDSGGVETTGYSGAGWNYADAATPAVASNSEGFKLMSSSAAAAVYHGHFVLVLEDSSDNTWSFTSQMGRSDSAAAQGGAGTKALSATLDRVRITTNGGIDTFDAGAINILYE